MEARMGRDSRSEARCAARQRGLPHRQETPIAMNREKALVNAPAILQTQAFEVQVLYKKRIPYFLT
jgi:hypothetical protein